MLWSLQKLQKIAEIANFGRLVAPPDVIQAAWKFSRRCFRNSRLIFDDNNLQLQSEKDVIIDLKNAKNG